MFISYVWGYIITTSYRYFWAYLTHLGYIMASNGALTKKI